MLQRILKHFQSKGQQKNSQQPTSRLNVESLESRIVLTATAGSATLSNGVLNICGTDAAETIIVAERSDGYFVAAGFLSSAKLFSKSEVTSIVVDAGAGDDTIVSSSMTSTINQNEGTITLNGQAGNDRIFGGSSDDILDGGLGNDLIYGNGGVDTIYGGNGADVIHGGTGNDLVNGGAGNDRIIGNEGDDKLRGGEDDDVISGSAGNDQLFGELGNDQLFGGTGDDEQFGNEGRDIVVGDSGNDDLFGDEGHDILLGSSGNDRLFGGGDNDRLVGGTGDDELNGGDGLDELFGGSGGDDISGGAGADRLFGGLGPDTLLGGTHNDVIFGGNGDDILAGNDGDDELDAGDGKDILIGGTDVDSLKGGSNEDLMVAGSTPSETNVTDLKAVRAIWLTSANFAQRLAGVQAISNFTPTSPNNADRLTGNNGLDAFFAFDVAQTVDRQANEPLIAQGFAAVSDSFDANINETITIAVDAGVISNDILAGVANPTVSIVTQPDHGSLTLNADGSFEFVMDTHGRDSFTYELNALGQTPSQATVTIVTPSLPQLPAGASLTLLASGLEVFDFTLGTGGNPGPMSDVIVDYIGYLPNGDIFDQGTNSSFNVSGVIDGFGEGLQGMEPGGRRRMVIPPDLGYGAGGNPGAGIDGTDTIIFDVTLDSFS